MDAPARLEELLSPRGRELLGRLRQEAVTPDTALRVSARLRAEYPAELVRDALAQHELRLAYVTYFADFAPLWKDPRFQELRARMDGRSPSTEEGRPPQAEQTGAPELGPRR